MTWLQIVERRVVRLLVSCQPEPCVSDRDGLCPYVGRVCHREGACLHRLGKRAL